MSRFNSLVSTRFLRLFMPYDLYERHAVASRLLQEALKNIQESIHILDVGGRAKLLERFTPYRVISINTDGSGNLTGSGCALPFLDSSFVAVVSIDTLEHLPQENRLPFLRECLRVSQRYVIVAAPFGSEGHSKCEKRLDKLYRSIYGESHIYLSEHVKYGLPDMVELDQFAKQGAKARGCGQPSKAPARHQPGLGKAVDDDNLVLVLAYRHEGRRHRAVVDDAGIDLVGDDPNAPASGEVEDGPLVVGGHQPAGRIAR